MRSSVCACVVFGLGLFACSSDGTDGAPVAGGGAGGALTGGMPGMGGVTASGGMTASGGVPASGGVAASGGTPATGGASTSPLYVCDGRPPRDPGGSGVADAACCGGKGKCVATGTTPNTGLGHDTCGSSLVCAPTDATLTAPTAFAKCATKIGVKDPAGAEGRCVPKCFTLGNAQAVILDNGGTCAADEVCAPCFNPADGKPTGACGFKAGDAPTSTAPAPYAACPGPNTDGVPQGGGVCVPETALTALTAPTHPYYNPSIPGLKQGTCTAGEKCVPAQKANDPGFCFAKCTTSQTTQAVGGSPDFKYGACTPKYVVYDVAGNAGVSVTEGGGPCQAAELCAPCKDPLKDGAPSGSCY